MSKLSWLMCRTSSIAIGVLCAGAAAAAEPRAVSLSEAIDAATKAPAHEAAARRAEAAAVAVDAAGGWPMAAFGAATTIRSAHAIVSASVPLPVFGTLSRERAVARGELRVADAQGAALDVELRRRVAVAWIALAVAEARAVLLAQGATRDESLALVAKKRFDAGDVPRAEVVTTGAAAARSRSQATAAAMAVGAASAALAGELGWDPESPLRAGGSLPAVRALPSLSELRVRVARHPEVTLATARVRAEAARVRAAQGERWPTLSLDVETAIEDPGLPGSDFRFGISVDVPLFGRRGRAVDVAIAREEALRADRTATQASLDAEVVTAWRSYEAAACEARALDDMVLPAIRESARLAAAAYREGQQGVAFVLVADRAVIEAELDRVTALGQAAQALSDLERAVGGAL